MANKLEVSFNSQQCRWMSIGFADRVNEFTRRRPRSHCFALAELLRILTALLDKKPGDSEFLLKWNRDPRRI